MVWCLDHRYPLIALAFVSTSHVNWFGDDFPQEGVAVKPFSVFSILTVWVWALIVSSASTIAQVDGEPPAPIEEEFPPITATPPVGPASQADQPSDEGRRAGGTSSEGSGSAGESTSRLSIEDVERLSEAITGTPNEGKETTFVEWITLLVAGGTLGLGFWKFRQVDSKVAESKKTLDDINRKIAEEQQAYNADESLQLKGVFETTRLARDGSKKRQSLIAAIRIENMRREPVEIDGVRFVVTRKSMDYKMSKLWDSSGEALGFDEKKKLPLGRVVAVDDKNGEPEFLQEKKAGGGLSITQVAINSKIKGGEFRTNILRLFVLQAEAPQILKVDIQVKLKDVEKPLSWSGLCGIGRMADSPVTANGSTVVNLLSSEGAIGHQANDRVTIMRTSLFGGYN